METPTPSDQNEALINSSRKVIYYRTGEYVNLNSLEPNSIVVSGDLGNFKVEDILATAKIDTSIPSIIHIEKKNVLAGELLLARVVPGWELRIYENPVGGLRQKIISIVLISDAQFGTASQGLISGIQESVGAIQKKE